MAVEVIVKITQHRRHATESVQLKMWWGSNLYVAYVTDGPLDWQQISGAVVKVPRRRG